MQSRFGMMPGGSQPLAAEQVPDWAWESPEYWYARYTELEKAYRDIGQQIHQQNMQQGNAAMMFARGGEENEDTLNEILGLASIAVSIGTLLFALRGVGYHSLSTGVILGISFVGMVIAQRIELPHALSRVKSILASLYPQNETDSNERP